MKDSFTMCTTYIETQNKLVQRERETGQAGGRHFVTISRQTGAGATTIARQLVKYLEEHDKSALCPWTVFDKNLVQKVLEEHNLPQRFRPYLKEKRISEMEDWLEELFGVHPSKWILEHKMAETIMHLGQLGNVILVGRGANIITRNLGRGLHVRLIGSLERRIGHIAEYYGLDPEKAAALINKQDRNRANYIKEYFDRKIDDHLLYDLIINTDRVNYQETAGIIGETLLNRIKQAKHTHHS